MIEALGLGSELRNRFDQGFQGPHMGACIQPVVSLFTELHGMSAGQFETQKRQNGFHRPWAGDVSQLSVSGCARP